MTTPPQILDALGEPPYIQAVYYLNLHKITYRGIALVVFLSTPASSAQAETHEVRQGDTISELAERFGVSADDLRRWNRLESDLILLGQTLTIRPAAASDGSEDVPENLRPYVIEVADTLGCIAARFGLTVDALSRINRGLDPDQLRTGQQLNVPASRVDLLESGAAGRRIVREGETLGALATELGVGVEDLLSWNPGLDPDRISAGQELVIRGTHRAVHVVAQGERLSSIAERHRVTSRDISRWNPALDPDRLSVGQRLVLWTSQAETESVGSATCGRLINGRTLTPHPAYVIRDLERSYATEETISAIGSAFDEVLRAHPNVLRVRVHDLSLPEGGPINDHQSNQSGRDVDIVYFQRSCPTGVCQLRPVLPRELAVGPQWTMLRHWLRQGAAQRILIDYGLQEVLYSHARRQGATTQELEQWFQYPRGRNAEAGVIRHFPNHFDHVHVRFVCPESDERCQ